MYELCHDFRCASQLDWLGTYADFFKAVPSSGLPSEINLGRARRVQMCLGLNRRADSSGFCHGYRLACVLQVRFTSSVLVASADGGPTPGG